MPRTHCNELGSAFKASRGTWQAEAASGDGNLKKGENWSCKQCQRCKALANIEEWQQETAAAVGENGGGSSMHSSEQPFGEDGKEMPHLPPIAKEIVANMTEEEVEAILKDTPLEHIQYSTSLSRPHLLILKKLILCYRDVFALNDQAPPISNASGMTIDTGTARPQCTR